MLMSEEEVLGSEVTANVEKAAFAVVLCAHV